MISEVIKTADEIEEKIIRYRRSFHKYPEYGWTEYRTSALIAKRLEELGYTVLLGRDIIKEEDRMGLPPQEELEESWQRALDQGGEKKYLDRMRFGFTGVVGILSNGEGPVKAFRFDIDALPIQESMGEEHFPYREGFASANAGVMHACGHDCHSAVGLGIAEVLSTQRKYLRGTVKLIFQPAEEGVRGAKSIVAKGILDDVDMVFGHHMREYKVGEISSGISGYIATKKFDVHIKGKKAHAGGNPQEGNNALMAASTAAINLYAITRHKGGATRVNVGRMTAGSGRNIIPDTAHLVAETRGANSEISRYMYEQAENIIKHSCLMHNCSYQIIPMGEAPSGESDPELMRLVEEAAYEIGDYTPIDIHTSGGSEDFTYMMAKVQENGGKAVNIGIGADIVGNGAHSDDFDVNEKALKKAVVLLGLLSIK